MTILALLRHAKAVASDPAGDHERALDISGREAALVAGQTLRALMPRIDLALVSDALRTRETLTLALPPPDEPLTVRIEPNLYGASPDTMLAMLRDLDGGSQSVLIVGHNPGIAELARRLSSSGRASDLAALKERFPTATVALLDFGALAWKDLRPKSGTLTHFAAEGEAG